MRTSPIQHPPRSRYVVLRPHYLELCGGHAAGAALLALLENWTISRLERSDDELWLRLPMREVREWLCGAFGRTAVETGVEKLLELGLIEVENGTADAPTKRYRLAVDRVNQKLRELCRNQQSPCVETSKGALSKSAIPRAGDTGVESKNPNNSGGDDSRPSAESTARQGHPDPRVEDVWRYWCERRHPRRTDLEESQAKLITRGLNARFEVDELKRAIDALLASDWHRQHSKLQLSVIFATRPGGPTLRDQIESWIERSSSPAPTSVGSGSSEGVNAAAIAAAKTDVMRAHQMPHSRQAQDAKRRAVERLRKHGVTVIEEPGQRPRFEEVR